MDLTIELCLINETTVQFLYFSLYSVTELYIIQNIVSNLQVQI